jgi:primosomal replication protein N
MYEQFYWMKKWMINKIDELSNERSQQNNCEILRKKKPNGIISCWFILKHTTHKMLK